MTCLNDSSWHWLNQSLNNFAWNFPPLLTNHSLQVRKSFWWRASFTNCLLQDHPQILCWVEIRTLCWPFKGFYKRLARWTGALSSCKIVALPLCCLSATTGKNCFCKMGRYFASVTLPLTMMSGPAPSWDMQSRIISDGLLTLSLWGLPLRFAVWKTFSRSRYFLKIVATVPLCRLVQLLYNLWNCCFSFFHSHNETLIFFNFLSIAHFSTLDVLMIYLWLKMGSNAIARAKNLWDRHILVINSEKLIEMPILIWCIFNLLASNCISHIISCHDMSVLTISEIMRSPTLNAKGRLRKVSPKNVQIIIFFKLILFFIY